MEPKAKIFMVDDDPYLVQVVRCVFEAEGYAFASARCAKDALAVVDEVAPDLIILDVMMEDVDAGLRVLHVLRNNPNPDHPYRYANVPILMFTSVEQRTRMKSPLHPLNSLLAIDGFLEKPVQPRTLLAKVAELLRLR